MSSHQACDLHHRAVCSECIEVTDDGKRISDAISLAVIFHSWEEIVSGWMSFALQDGTTDHVVYPSRQDAIRHMSDENRYFYVSLRTCPAGMPPKDATILLAVHRHAHAAGFRFTEPQAPSLINPIARGAGSWPK